MAAEKKNPQKWGKMGIADRTVQNAGEKISPAAKNRRMDVEYIDKNGGRFLRKLPENRKNGSTSTKTRCRYFSHENGDFGVWREKRCDKVTDPHQTVQRRKWRCCERDGNRLGCGGIRENGGAERFFVVLQENDRNRQGEGGRKNERKNRMKKCGAKIGAILAIKK